MLFGNSFSGLLPWSWSKLTGLLSLSVGENTLHDRLPESWSALQHLHNLDLSVNSLEGSCPSKWSALADISHISLSFNLFAGHLPEEWSRLTNLKELSLSSNLFSGTLPSMWSALTGLRVLELGNNLVSGSIPLMWGHGLQNLRRLDLGWNSMLRGCLPEQWADLERRNQIFLQGTGIYGTGSCPLSSGDSSGADVPHLIPLAPPSPPEPVPTDRCGGPDLYQLLGIDASADRETMERVYHRLVLRYRYHPETAAEDSGQDLDKLRSYLEKLADPSWRAEYDRDCQ